MTTTYTAIYTYDPDDRVWLVELAEDARVHSYGRTLAAAKRMIRDAAGLWFEAEGVEIADEVEPPAEAAGAVNRYRQLRAELEQAQSDIKQAQADATGALRVSGLSMREISEVLGLSYQRVGQVAKGAAKTKGRKVAAIPAKRAAVKRAG